MTQVIQGIRKLSGSDTKRDGAVESGKKLTLSAYLPYQLAVASNRVSRMVARCYQGQFGLTIWEWRVIAVLGEGRPVSAQELGDAAAMDKVTVSRAVKSLSQRALIAKKRNEADRRSLFLSLTDEGQAVYDKVVPVALAAEEALIDGLSVEDIRALETLLTVLRGRAEGMRVLPLSDHGTAD